MNDNLIRDDEEMEVLVTSAQLVGEEKLEESDSSDNDLISSQHPKSLWALSFNSKRTSARKKKKKGKRKRKKEQTMISSPSILCVRLFQVS